MAKTTEESQQKIYDTLRQSVTARLVRADIAEADISNLSLGELINILFLLHGDSGSTGNFSVSFHAALKLVGAAAMWEEPNRVAVMPQRIQ